MKKTIVIILVFVMVFCTAACQNGADDPNKQGQKGQEISEQKIQEQTPSVDDKKSEEKKNPVVPTSDMKVALEDWPKIDGATAFLPYYTGVAASLLGMEESEAAQYIMCNTTDFAYPNLLAGAADLIYCLAPSDDQVERARQMGVRYEGVPILNEGFVFFVNKNNPVDNVTIEQLHDIYTGKITNWKELGGFDEEIIPYQRTEGSGSQTGLYKFVAGPDEVINPDIKEHRASTMFGIVDLIVSFEESENNGPGIGYSYYYFVTEQDYQEDVKLLKINGIEPSKETIANGSYPMISPVYAVYKTNTPEDSIVRTIALWAKTEAGQILADEKNYVKSEEDTIVRFE